MSASKHSYVSALIKDPSIASLVPTSQHGVRRILSSIDFSKKMLVIEYGPARGVITEQLLSHLSADSTVLAIEKNSDFADTVRQLLPDPRLIVHNGSAADITKILAQHNIQSKAQHVISGIPFSMFPVTLKEEIMTATQEILESGGSFIVYQFLLSLASGKNDIKYLMDRYFSVRRKETIFKNIPPLRLFEGYKE